MNSHVHPSYESALILQIISLYQHLSFKLFKTKKFSGGMEGLYQSINVMEWKSEARPSTKDKQAMGALQETDQRI